VIDDIDVDDMLVMVVVVVMMLMMMIALALARALVRHPSRIAILPSTIAQLDYQYAAL